MSETTFNQFQTIKRHFFAMRNGVIADTLRKAGSPFRIIFGLNLPQIVEIANETGKDTELARQLWANNSTRESMLMAPMVFTPADMTIDEARRWIAESPAAEVTDVLCLKLLRHLPLAWNLAESTPGYAGMRLTANLMYADAARAHAIAEAHAATATGAEAQLAQMVLDETEFMLES